MARAWFVDGQRVDVQIETGWDDDDLQSPEDIIEELSFETDEALRAFKMGLERGIRWDDMEMGVYDTREEALLAAAEVWRINGCAKRVEELANDQD